MEKKITIIEAIKKVMQEKGTPMTTKEIYDEIISSGLYIFGSSKESVGKGGSLIGGFEMIFRNPQSVKKSI